MAGHITPWRQEQGRQVLETRRNWLESDFQYAGFKSFRDQPKAQAVAKKYGDPKLVTALSGVARARQSLKEPWWPHRDVFHQGELQAAMLAQKAPIGAVKALAADAERLKAEDKKEPGRSGRSAESIA